MTKRKSGYYWIMILNTGRWNIGEWINEIQSWVITGSEKEYFDSDLGQIYGTRIKELATHSPSPDDSGANRGKMSDKKKDDYQPFNEEWKIEMMKWRKLDLIDALGRAWRELREKPNTSLLCKLGSIVVHTQEAKSTHGHDYDWIALNLLLADPEIEDWIEKMDKLALIPKKRKQ